MKRIHSALLIAVAVAIGLLSTGVRDANAVSFFKKGFAARYVKEKPSTDGEKALAAAYAERKCYTCHVKGKDENGKKISKKVHNAYGVALAKLIKKKDFTSEKRAADPDKAKATVQAALEKVEGMKVDASKADSPTWGDLLKKGKLAENKKP
jgi:hypothetical protein